MTAPTTRPRVEGEREAEIFDATARLLVEWGYDKLTFDAVAAAARASKATLYRRWRSKADLVIDLLEHLKGVGLQPLVVSGALIPALHRDDELTAAFQRRFIAPKLQVAVAAFERARARGEVGADADT